MNKKCIRVTRAGGVALFMLGFVFYGLLLTDFFANDAMMKASNYLALAGGEVVGGALLALVLSWQGSEVPGEAFKSGGGHAVQPLDGADDARDHGGHQHDEHGGWRRRCDAGHVQHYLELDRTLIEPHYTTSSMYIRPTIL